VTDDHTSRGFYAPLGVSPSGETPKRAGTLDRLATEFRGYQTDFRHRDQFGGAGFFVWGQPRCIVFQLFTNGLIILNEESIICPCCISSENKMEHPHSNAEATIKLS